MFVSVSLCWLPISAKDVIPGGESAGIQISYDGILISGTYTYQVNKQTIDPSNEVHVSDIITHVNGVRVRTLEEFRNELYHYRDPINHVNITLKRNQESKEATLTTSYDGNTVKSGLYVKDKITGVGTISFYDPERNVYGALGHEILDTDTNEIADIHTGTLYPATVDGIQKAKKNVPGEKDATIDFNHSIGTVKKNTIFGIYGTYEQAPNKEAIPVATRDEVHTGKAMIATVLHGDTLQYYQVNITKLHKQKEKDVKGIELSIDDPTLAKETNGIIQGMSGSPIIQDGKLIGVLTHVITSDPMKGYGVYIDWMLDESAM